MHLKVLIIEDNEDDAALLGHYLKSCGFDPRWQKVDCQKDLAQAVEDRRWDLVLCDFSMPELTPFLAVDCVRKTNPDIPIIIVTGAISELKAAELFEYGVQDVVLKDDLPRLKKTITRELHLSQNRHERIAAELRFAAALDKLSQGVALYDRNARLITCNRQYKLGFDLCRDEIVPGISYAELLNLAIERGQFAFDKGSGDQTFQRVLACNVSTGEQPLEIPHHNGRWLEIERHRTEDGGIVTVTTDITEKKQREKALMRQTAEFARINKDLMREIGQRMTVENALRESESRARAIFESAVDGVITFNEDCVIETVNPAVEKLFGYSADELKGLHIHHLVLLGDGGNERVPGALLRRTEPDDFGNANLRLVTGWKKNGEAFPIELTISQVKLSNRFIYTGIIRDVTERMKLDRMKSEFVSVVSHELRTPLTSIRGSLALLTTSAVGELPPRAKSMISIGIQNSERLLRLINDILDMEKIESGKMEFTFEPIRARKLIEAAIEEHRTFLDQFKVHLQVEDRDGLNIMVRGDYGRLMQVLTNLLSNAAKYSPEGGTITIGAQKQAETIRIWVQDEGAGIPDAFHDEIFQKFSQADASDTRQKGGTGLGLSIAKAIVEHHGGKIDFETAKGRGTRFFFDLPIYLAEVRSAEEMRVS
jgi:PAS domain S-box-containing protein